jgi:hypothetical protein
MYLQEELRGATGWLVGEAQCCVFEGCGGTLSLSSDGEDDSALPARNVKYFDATNTVANDCIKSLILGWQVTCEKAHPGHDFAAEVAVASSDKGEKRALVKHPINAGK